MGARGYGLVRLRTGEAIQTRSDREICLGVQFGICHWLLHEVAHAGPPGSHLRGRDARDPYRPARGAEYPEEQAHERGLPRSIQAYERVDLAPANLEVEVEDARRR